MSPRLTCRWCGGSLAYVAPTEDWQWHGHYHGHEDGCVVLKGMAKYQLGPARTDTDGG